MRTIRHPIRAVPLFATLLAAVAAAGPWHGVGRFTGLADGLTSDPSAVSWGGGRIDAFARGADNALYHKAYDGSWREWESLGGTITSGPDASTWGSGRLDVFARGGDNALYHKAYTGSWGDWESLGGTITSDPAAVSWGAGRIDVFARGADNTLYHKAYEGGWGDWESLGGQLTSGPDVCQTRSEILTGLSIAHRSPDLAP